MKSPRQIAAAGPDLVSVLDTIHRQGGRIIAAPWNLQPDPALRIASVHYGGHVGIGPDVEAAARDWLRRADAAEAQDARP